MGRIAGAYGVRGWVKVAPRGTQPALAAAEEWWIGEEPRTVREARVHGATVIARLEGVETREQAQALKGRPVAVRRELLPSPGEGRYYTADLAGLEVVNLRGERLGVVTRTHWNGAQDVIEVAGPDGPRLLPWVGAVVKEVDLAARRVRVDWEPDW